ncbi:hypothetical protein LCGC14_2642970, partial [marine sediment metagenome]
MSDFETKEHFQLHQQRFEAALAFATSRLEYDYEDAVIAADALLRELRETSELTP